MAAVLGDVGEGNLLEVAGAAEAVVAAALVPGDAEATEAAESFFSRAR